MSGFRQLLRWLLRKLLRLQLWEMTRLPGRKSPQKEIANIVKAATGHSGGGLSLFFQKLLLVELQGVELVVPALLLEKLLVVALLDDLAVA